MGLKVCIEIPQERGFSLPFWESKGFARLPYLQLDHRIQKELSVKAVLHPDILLQDIICGQKAPVR